MKILHAADLHLDTAFTGHSEADTQYLKKALLSVPDAIARLCRVHQCDMLLLAGDLFDAEPTPESLQALRQMLQEVAVPVFITPGNHDFCHAGSPYLNIVWPENVHIFTQNRMESVALPGLDCRVYGAGFLSMDCDGLLEGFHAEGGERWQVGVLHGDPLQRRSPYCAISQAQVAESGLHYLALGHIHKAGQFTAGSTLCAWPGCPMGRGNDETGDKGVYLVTLDDQVRVEFLPLDTPRFYDLEVEVSTTPEQALQSTLPAAGSEDFYRVTLTGECAPFAVSQLRLPGFPRLEIRDRTVPPTPLWDTIGQDSLEGIFFRMLHEAMETGETETVLLAAKIARRILDGREVQMP